MASMFTTIYFVVYSTQSPNMALLSCLLRTLGIVSHLTLNILSCLLRTLAVWTLATVAHNSLGVFSYGPHTYCITEVAEVAEVAELPVVGIDVKQKRWPDWGLNPVLEVTYSRYCCFVPYISSFVIMYRWHICKVLFLRFLPIIACLYLLTLL